MLILSRKVKQSIDIGDDIRIVINSINGSRVSVAIDAPDHVRIRRSELETKEAESK